MALCEACLAVSKFMLIIFTADVLLDEVTGTVCAAVAQACPQCWHAEPTTPGLEFGAYC